MFQRFCFEFHDGCELNFKKNFMKTKTLGKLQTSFSGNHSFHRDYGPTEIKSIISRNRDTIYGKRLFYPQSFET